MNRFARIGETADPCGIPLLRCSRAQSGRLSGAASHRSTYNSTPAAVGDRPDRLGHEVPRHLIEELLDVEIDHPVVLPAPRPTRRDRVMGRLARPVAVGVRVKPVVRPRLQMHGHDRLRDPIGDRRHAQHSDTRAVRLGDLDRLDREWKVRPRTHPVPDLVEVVRKIGLERLEILPVHSWRALVGLDPPPRLPDHRLGKHKRLVFGLWHVRSLPPEASTPVVRSDIPDQPAPWLHRHPSSSGFTATTGRSASERRLGTQCLRFLPLAGSLSRPWRPTTPVAVSTLAFSRSVQEPQTRLTPPSRRAPPGQSSGHPPGSSRENSQTPRFRCHLDYANDASTAHPPHRSPGRAASGTSSWSPPDASSAPSPYRSPRRSSANAAQGGLTPPPEGRRRRANKPPSLAQHRLCEDRLHQSSFSVRDARLLHKASAVPSGGVKRMRGWRRTFWGVIAIRCSCCRRAWMTGCPRITS